MTVAVAIEIRSGGTLAPGLNKVQGSGQDAVANQSFSQPIASGTETFRIGWQSLLASLRSDAEDFSETAAAENQGAPSVTPELVDAAGESPAATLPSNVGVALRTRQESEKGTGPACAGLKLSQTDARAVSSAVRSATSLKRIAISNTEVRKTTVNLEPESAIGSRWAHSAKTTESEVTTAGALPEPVTAIVATTPQAVIVTNPVTHDTAALTQPSLEEAQTDILRNLFVNSSTGLAADNFSLHSPDLDSVGRTASASAQNAVSGTETSTAAIEAVRPVGPQAEGGNAHVATGIPTQAAAPNLAKEQASSETQPLTSSADLMKPLSTSQVLPLTQALDQSEVQIQLGAKAFPVAQDSGELKPLPIPPNVVSSGQPLAVSPIQGKNGPVSEKKLSASDSLQLTRETGKSDSVQHENHITQGQPSGPDADTSALVRAVAGAGGTTDAPAGLAPRTPAATSVPESREAFTTLDAEGAAGRPTWIHAGAQRAEAGFHDPALGWVGVRADTSGGGVHAELVSGSADAAQTLGGHLAGLSAYLDENPTPVETLTLSSSGSGWTAPGNGHGSGDGMQQGAGHQTREETTQRADSRAHSGSSTAPELSVWSVDRDGSARTARQDGNHISVMA